MCQGDDFVLGHLHGRRPGSELFERTGSKSCGSFIGENLQGRVEEIIF